MFFIGQTDRQTEVQLKTIVRNLTKIICQKNDFVTKKVMFTDLKLIGAKKEKE